MKVNCDDIGIEKAIQIVKQGGIVIFPTDTVYGIGCDPYNKESVKKVYNLKSREFSKPFPILVDSKETAKKIVEFDEITEKITEKFWPGPLTIILKLTDDKLKKSLNLEEKIAIRIPNNKCTLKLLKKCNFLVGTSANISNQKSVSDPNECLKNVQDFDVFIDGGIIDSKGESTIIEIEDEKIKIIREGSLSKNEIIKC